MNTATIVLLIVLGVMIIAVIALYFLGKKAQKRQDEQQAQMEAVAQTVALTIIDKKKMRMKDAGFPTSITSQIPWYGRNAKMPIVKCKVGPKIMNLLCDANLFEELPLKKEVKATVSGLYITSVKGLHGHLELDKKKKKSWRVRLQEKAKDAQAQLKADKASKGKKK